MRIDKKIYWKVRNFIQARIMALRGGDIAGCLPDRKDPRDYPYLGGVADSKPASERLVISNDLWRFDQRPFNICVFASAAMGASYQEGIRFSTKFYVQMAKRLGMITGNGFSYLRAAREISQKYGRLPYEYMPDEIGAQTWEQYSRYTITDEMLKIAAQYKAPNYRTVRTEAEAIDALDNGYVLFTANDWYSDMNRPYAPEYLLRQTGRKVGGHAFIVDVYNAPKKSLDSYETTQTFGFLYGKEGRAKIVDIFTRGYYSVFIEEKLPGRTDADRLVSVYNGLCVKGQNSSEIYKIEDGFKRHIKDWETFTRMANQFYTVSDSLLKKVPAGESI